MQIATDLQQFAEEVELSLKEGIVYKSHLVVATNEYLILWGDDDTCFDPIIIPRKMIIESEVIDRKKGIYGANRRVNIMGIYTLSNGMKKEALLCGQFETKRFEKIQAHKII